MRLLLVEDNTRLSSLIAAGLVREGFEVDTATSVSEGLAAVAAIHFDAAILDIGLPDGDGLSIAHYLRGRGSAVPILVLTARGSVRDRVKGLGQGADDYLGKPFDFDELVARIRALLRRPAAYLGDQLRLGHMVFDPREREIVVSGRRSSLGSREAALLEALMRRINHVVPKKVIEDQLYGLSDEGSSNAIEVCIHRLRKQLASCRTGATIHTIRGVGYLIKESKM